MAEVDLRSCQELQALYSGLVIDIKNGSSHWEDVISKGGRVFTSLRATVTASTAFLDSIQRLADLASNTTGGSKEIGACFTRLCMRQKRLGTKVKTMSNQLVTSMVNPLSARLVEWKRNLALIEKQHSREAKRTRADLKRAAAEANRLHRKFAKQEPKQTKQISTIGIGVGKGRQLPPSRIITSGIGTSSLTVRLDTAMQDLDEKVRMVEDVERAYIRRLMLEERSRYCFFFNCLKPSLESELSIFDEVSTLNDLVKTLEKSTADPSQLLGDAESILARAGSRIPGLRGSTSSAPNSTAAPGFGEGTNEVDAFAVAVASILSNRNPLTNSTTYSASTTTTANASLSSERTSVYSAASSSQQQQHSSEQVSIHSMPAASFCQNGHQPQTTSIRCQPQTDANPRSLSAGRMVYEDAEEDHQTNSNGNGSQSVVLRRTNQNSHSRPATLAHISTDAGSIPSNLPASPSTMSNAHQRQSTCTLLQPTCSLNAMCGEQQEVKAEEEEEEDDEEEDEYTDGDLTADSEGAFSDDNHGRPFSVEDIKSGRHTISSAYEQSNSIKKRPPISILTRSGSRSAVNSNTILYPDQILPPPVYTNLTQLTTAAQRKFSMSTSSQATSPSGAEYYQPSASLSGVFMTRMATASPDTASIASAPQSHYAVSQVSVVGSGADRTPRVQSASRATSVMLGYSGQPSLLSQEQTARRPRIASVASCSSVSRASVIGVGTEDPFSVEMDELDRMVTGSSAASSVNSRRSTQSRSRPVSQHSSILFLSHHTGVPVGLETLPRYSPVESVAPTTTNQPLATPSSNDRPVNETLSQWQTNPNDCQSIGEHVTHHKSQFAVPVATSPPPASAPTNGQPALATITTKSILVNSNSSVVTQPKLQFIQFPSTDDDDVDIRATNVASTAANLLSQLSGQLQQLTTSQAQPQTSLSSVAFNSVGNSAPPFQHPDSEYEMPAPPSPDFLR